LYEGSTIGAGLETGHQVLIRAGCEIGVNARIGTQTALEGELTIGDYARIQGYSVFGCGTVLGDFVWIFPKCVFTNDPLPPSSVCEPVTVGDGAVICTNTIVMPGCDIGYGAFVASGAKPKGVIPPAAVVLADGRVGGPVTHLIHIDSGTGHVAPLRRLRHRPGPAALGARSPRARRCRALLRHRASPPLRP